jgi:chemotaxis protein histidine kinase CheA
LKSQEVKVLCDFFKLDRSGITSKEDLIDRLLDFLGTINEDLLKSNKSGGASKSKASKKKKKKAPAKKKKKKVEESEEDESEEDAEDEEEEAEEEEAEDEEKEKGDDDDDAPLSKQPTDQALRRWVKAYIACFNMDKATIKHALETASDKFGVDLSEKKQKIKQILTEEM